MTPPVPAPPDWAAIPHDVRCPLCEYNLRGLADPRCPECGYQFAWADVTDPATRPHPYLFEHHPERNVWSFCRTLAGTLRPVWFWRGLSPAQPSRPGRMKVYWLLTSALMFAWVLGEWARAVVEWSQAPAWITPLPWPGQPPAAGTPGLSWELFRETARIAWQVDDVLRYTLLAALGWLAWPWLTLMVLMLFRTSMGKARIGVAHVVRCLVYSFDLGAWFGVALGIVVAALPWLGLPFADAGVRLVLFGLLAATVVVRLWIAFRIYLRFDHAFWTVAASQAIVFLLALNALVLWVNLRRPLF